MSVQPTQTRVMPRPGWDREAACMDKPFEWFFGSEESPLTPPQAKPGRVVCRGCAVRVDCLVDALVTKERHGLRGGYLATERFRALARHNGSVRAALRDDAAGTFARRTT